MADNSGMADIRGIDIDKLVKGFADEENILKQFCNVSTTSAREIRWYQKTAGFVATPTTTAITTSLIENTDFGSLPFVAEQSWTRNTSYIRKYFVESPMMNEEDIKDCDIDILATNIRDLVRAVARRVDERIVRVLTENYTPATIQTAAATATWATVATCNPILDLMNAKQKIRSYGYNPEGAVCMLNSIEHKFLMNYLINVKGSSIPSFANAALEKGVVMEILGLKVVVSENFLTTFACIFVPQRAVTWKEFMPITSTVITDEGIGRKVRVWEEGNALLTDPKAVFLITATA